MRPLDKFVTPKKEAPIPTPIKNNMGIVTEWINKRCRTKGTKKGYRLSLFRFLRAIYGENTYPFFKTGGTPDNQQRQVNKRHKILDSGIQRYFDEDRNFVKDFNNFILWMNKEKYAPKSIHSTLSMVKKFFLRHGHKLTDEEWEDLKGLLAPNKPRTQDKTLTKEQLKSVLNHLGLGMRALILFLASTGARIGETLQLKIGDINLGADPPEVNVRPQYTKKEVGGRVIWFSYEARDAIREWLKAKVNRKKKTGESFSKDKVFGFSEGTTTRMWHIALQKAGLDQRDPSTKTRIFLYHLHTLRKFFSTQMGDAGVPESTIHAWMGHTAYLEAEYKRHSLEKLAKTYRDHMDAVSVYGSGSVSEFRRKLDAIEEESRHDKEDIRKANELLDKLGVPDDRPLEERLLIGFSKLAEIKQLAPKEPSYEEPKRDFQQAKPQLPKSEPLRHTKPVQKPQVLMKPTEKHKVDDWVVCPDRDDWVRKSVECKQCRQDNFKKFKECWLERRKNPSSDLFKCSKPKPNL